MRTSLSYRGARRNAARADRKRARAEKRPGELLVWRRTGKYALAANEHAKINERAAMANEAREVASKALVEHGILGYRRREDVVLAAFVDFYGKQKPTRNVSRIMRELNRQKRAA